jgi:isopenicillin-N N-acyltransferase like protein
LEILRVEASGSPFDIGYTVGKRAAGLLAQALPVYEKILLAAGVLPWDDRAYLRSAEEEFPSFVEELRGMAAGSGQDFRRLFLLNALEEAMDEKGRAACTCGALKGPEGPCLGHNEDWYAADARHVLALLARPRGKPAFLTITAAPFLAAVGMNEHGIAQGVNSLESTDTRQGVPRMFSARAVLEARGLPEAKRRALNPKRAGGYNHLLVARTGEMGSLETSAGKDAYLPYGRFGVHTNHYLSPSLTPLEKGRSLSSQARWERGCRVLSRELHGSTAAEVLMTMLSDHGDGENSICRHADSDTGDATIFSAVFDVAGGRVWATAGNPCRGRFPLLYEEGSFTAWQQGEAFGHAKEG